MTNINNIFPKTNIAGIDLNIYDIHISFSWNKNMEYLNVVFLIKTGMGEIPIENVIGKNSCSKVFTCTKWIKYI